LIHFIPMNSYLEFALELFLYPQNILPYNKDMEQERINPELMLIPREANRMS